MVRVRRLPTIATGRVTLLTLAAQSRSVTVVSWNFAPTQALHSRGT